MTERSAYPDDREVRAAEREFHDLDLACAFIGRVHRYDRELGVVDVVPMVRQQVPQPNGDYTMEEIAIIPHAPLLWPRMGPWFMAASVELGDSVLCVVLDGDYAPWWDSRATEGLQNINRALRGIVSPGDLRRHHLAHAVAIPMGMEPRWNALRHAPPRAANSTDATACLTLGSDQDEGTRLTIFGNGRLLVTKGDSTMLEMEPDGTVHLAGAPAATKLLALAELVDDRLETLRDKISGHSHGFEATVTGGGGGGVSGTTSSADTIPALQTVATTKTLGV